jgi:hypothetical protein
MADKISSGEEKAWEIILNLDSVDVCKRVKVAFDRETASYQIKSFGFDFSISLLERKIKNVDAKGEILTKKLSYFFNHSVLSYLVNAKEIPLSGRLIQPRNIGGGEIFFRGTHILPLDRVSEKYGNDKEGFISRGKELDGKFLDYGDASVELHPLPRIPVTLILWLSDEEFPARTDILFDSTCEIQMPIDIIWSIAMMSILAFL